MSSQASDDVVIEFEQNQIPIGQANFRIPLIVGQGGTGNGPTDEYNVYNSVTALTAAYDRTNNPRIVRWAEYMFSNGASRVAVLKVSGRAPSNGELSTALDNIAGEDFFYVCMTSREGTGSTPEGVAGDRADVAGWCDSNDRFFLATSNAGETATSIESDLNNNLQFDQLYFLAFENAGASLDSIDRPVDAAMAGRLASNFPGSLNFKFQQLEGVGASDYTATEISTIEGANGAVYLSKLGEPQTSQGFEPTGGYADIAIIKLWMNARFTESFFSVALAQDKIPYTAQGAEQVRQTIEDVLQEGVEEHLVARDAEGIPDYSINIPDIADISESDRTNRVLPDVEINTRLAGAVDQVDYTVVLRA